MLCECSLVGVGATQGHGNDKHGPPVTGIAHSSHMGERLGISMCGAGGGFLPFLAVLMPQVPARGILH